MNFLLEKISLIDLLPQSKEMKLKSLQDALRILETIEKLLFLHKQLKNNIISRNYGTFDSLIGENSCQIRAYILYNLFCEKSEDNLSSVVQEFFNSISNFLNYIKTIKHTMAKNKDYYIKNIFTEKSNITLEKFFHDYKLTINFPREILVSYLLLFLGLYTLSDNQGVHTGINYLKMQEDLSFSKNFSRRLVHKYQIIASKLSCEFIKLLAEDIKGIYPEYLSIFDLLIRKDDDGRFVIPCYFSMDIILTHMNLKSSWILIQQINSSVSEFKNFYFQLGKNKCLYSEISPENTPCIVFRGISNIPFEQNALKNILLNSDVKKLLLGSTARHPQYPGKNLQSLKENPFSNKLFDNLSSTQLLALNLIESNFLDMKDWALDKGCCLEQPKIFFVSHIFCENSDKYKLRTIIK